MNLVFYLRAERANKNGQIPIAISVSGNNIIFRKNISEVKSLPKHWDSVKQRLKPNKKNEEYNYHIEFNKKLDEFESSIKELFRHLQLNNLKLTKELIVLKLDGDSNDELMPDFLETFQVFIDKSKATRAERTITGYTTILNFLKKFQESGYPLEFNNIGLSFFDELSTYAFEKREIKNNYFARIISILKTFMTWSYDRGYHKNLDYLKLRFSEEDVEVIYLTYEELMGLYNHQFDSKKLEQVRDVYCFGCFTGLRYSDMRSLKSSNIYDDHILINIQKTRSIDHKIPFNKFSLELIHKYKGTIHEPLPIISSQKFNEYLKDCCELAEINQDVTITRYIGRKRVDQTLPKYKLITSHTARKTFVTNSLIKGMNASTVKSITGHKKDESFNKYIKIADDIKNKEMDKAWN